MTDIVERLRKRAITWLSFGWGNNDIYDEAADEIERLRKTNIMQARWLYEAQQENKLFKDQVRQWLDIGKPAAMEGE